MKGGFTPYNCFLKATQIGYNVSDYMVVGDDSLLNYWNLAKLDKNKIWTPPSMNFSCEKGVTKAYWYTDVRRMVTGIQSLKEKFGNIPLVGELTYDQFISNLRGKDICRWGVVDQYFIPKRFVEKVNFFYEHVGRLNAFTEFLPQLVLKGIADNPSDIVEFSVQDILERPLRKVTWDFYSSINSAFLHPVKFSDPKNFEPFCNLHLRNTVTFHHGELVGEGKKANVSLPLLDPPPK